jgi:hypothetical protein
MAIDHNMGRDAVTMRKLSRHIVNYFLDLSNGTQIRNEKWEAMKCNGAHDEQSETQCFLPYANVIETTLPRTNCKSSLENGGHASRNVTRVAATFIL